MTSERVRLGAVGAGLVAQAVHLPILLARGDLFEVAALCDLSPGTLEAVGERCDVASNRRYGAAADLPAAYD